MNSLVSVVLPVRNGEKYIRNAIDSVLAQTYPHYELVVVDASDDNTPKIVRSYDDDRIRYFRQKSKGPVNGYNEALNNYITGEYVTFIHHDDIYYPDKLYEQVRTIERFVDVTCVYNDIEFVDDTHKTLRVRSHEDYYHRSNDLLVDMMIGYGISNLGINVLTKREFIEEHGLRYSLEAPIYRDHVYMFEMLDAGAVFKHIAKPLIKYRVHDVNYSGDRDGVSNDIMAIYSRYTIEQLRAIIEASNYSPSEQAVIMGRLYYRLGHIDTGHKYLQGAIEADDDPWAMFYLGTGYYRYQGYYENAALWLKRGKESMPYRAEFANNLGCCLLQTRSLSDAKPYFEEAQRLMPEYCDAKYNVEHAESGEKFNPRLTDSEI